MSVKIDKELHIQFQHNGCMAPLASQLVQGENATQSPSLEHCITIAKLSL